MRGEPEMTRGEPEGRGVVHRGQGVDWWMTGGSEGRAVDQRDEGLTRGTRG